MSETLTGMYSLFCGVWAKQGYWRTLGLQIVVSQCERSFLLADEPLVIRVL